jgi:hypothetical protein
MFDVRLFYNVMRVPTGSIFLWKSIWMPTVPRRVAFFVWTAAPRKFLTVDNLCRGTLR